MSLHLNNKKIVEGNRKGQDRRDIITLFTIYLFKTSTIKEFGGKNYRSSIHLLYFLYISSSNSFLFLCVFLVYPNSVTLMALTSEAKFVIVLTIKHILYYRGLLLHRPHEICK